jgi:hypothetical protein
MQLNGLVVTLLTVSCALSASCKKDVEQLDEGAVKDGKRTISYLVEKAEEEQKAGSDQKAALERDIRQVQALIASDELDQAEALLSNVHWKPDPARSMVSDSAKELIRQYDERRQALQKVIDRKRAEKAPK